MILDYFIVVVIIIEVKKKFLLIYVILIYRDEDMQSIASLMSFGSVSGSDVGNLEDFDDECESEKSETTHKISEIASQLGFLAKSATLDTINSSEIGKVLSFHITEFYYDLNLLFTY